AKLDDGAIAGALDHAALVHGDRRVDQIAAQRAQAGEGAVLVRAGQPAEADDVGRQDRGKFPVLAHASPALRRPSTTRSKSSGFLYGSTLRRCSIEKLGLTRSKSRHASRASSMRSIWP